MEPPSLPRTPRDYPQITQMTQILVRLAPSVTANRRRVAPYTVHRNPFIAFQSCTTKAQYLRFHEDVGPVVTASSRQIPPRGILTFDICLLPFDLRALRMLYPNGDTM